MLGPHYVHSDKSQLLVNYVEDYLECVESLPLDIQRNVSLLREIDAKYQDVLTEVDDVFERYKAEADASQRRRLQVQLQRALIASQELGDQKIHVVTQMTELLENRSRQMDSHSLGLQDPVPDPPAASPVTSDLQDAPERSSARRPRRQRHSESRDSASLADDAADETPRDKKPKSTKKKKRKAAKQESEASPVDPVVDPDEPTYCLCQQVSYGEMIGCDNERCPIEWFHFSCVGLNYKPKGKWFCPKCRGDHEKTMDRRDRKDRRVRS